MPEEKDITENTYELEELAIQPGTYFNPQTEVVVIVDDSSSIDQEIFNMEDYENRRYNKQLATLFDVTVQDAKYRCLQHPLMEFIGGAAIAMFIWFGGKLVIDGVMTAGEFFALMTSLVVAYDPVKRLGKINSIIQQGLAAATRLYAILDIEVVSAQLYVDCNAG